MLCACVCVRVCVLFIKLHMTAQSDPVILAILRVCVFVYLVLVFTILGITAQSGPVVLVQSFYATRIGFPKGC